MKGKKIVIAVFFLFFVIQYVFQQTITVRIDPSVSYQTMEGFGASDCWAANYVGKHWNDDVKERIAEYLFSRDRKHDGSPAGIGLSLWRVNLGAGTAEQGDESNIGDISHRSECFLDEDGNYDWTKQAGQQYFMGKAKEYGCENFVAFSNSPLTIYTRNGKGYAAGDGNSNLKSDKYPDFADYLAAVAKHFEDKGMGFSYISPVNEPQYDWKADDDGNAGQEGSPWQNSELKKLLVDLDQAIEAKNVDTKILIAEAGSWEYIYKSKGRASNQLYEFFDRRSSNYVGNLPSVAPVMGAHSYWTHNNNSTIISTRSEAANEAKRLNIKLHQTEWSLLSEANSSVGYVDESPGYMDNALFMAKIIYSDIVYANVSTWSFWTAMDMERWDHKNRFLLLSLEPGMPGSPYSLITLNGIVNPRSTLWALGNYSLFVRPGYKRIKLAGADEMNNLLGTAYLSPDSSQIAAVFVNMAYEAKNMHIQFENIKATPLTNKRYVTNSLYDLRKYGSPNSDIYSPDRVLTMPARSVMTVVYELEKETSGISTTNFSGFQIYPNPLKQRSDLNIQLPGSFTNSTVEISILSMTGESVFQSKMKPTNGLLRLQISEKAISEGCYVIKVKSDGREYNSKLLIS
jgi:O-glycosyl hydrolase